MNNTTNQPSTSIGAWALPYGLIFGLILIIQTVLLYLVNLSYEKWAAIITYALFFGMSFFVIKKRKEYQQNFITLGEGFKAGFVALTIAVVISSTYLYIHMQYVDTHFLSIMIDKQITEMQEKGLTEAQIETSMEWIDKIMTPLTSTLIGLFSSIFTCLAFALISAALHKNERVLK